MRIHNEDHDEWAMVLLERMTNSKDRVLWKFSITPGGSIDTPLDTWGGIIFGGEHGPLVLRCDRPVRVQC